MEEISWPILLVVILACYIALLLVISKMRHPQEKHPPGPKPWPIIGNLNLIGSSAHQSLDSLSRKHGEIMFLKFGKFPVVVASSAEMARQFLRTNDATFASRPLLAGGKYMSYNYSDLVWAPYGPYWKQVRRIYMFDLFCPKRTYSFEHIRVEEMQNLVSRLYSLSGKPIIVKEQLSRHAFAIVCRMLFGARYSGETYHGHKSSVELNELRVLYDEWFELNGVFNIGDWIPWLDFLDLQGYVKRMKALSKKMDEFFGYIIDDHLATQNGSKDFVDTLLQLYEEQDLEVKLTRDCVKALVQNVIAGAVDTTPTTVEWTMCELMKHPHIIEKAKEELDRVIGKTRWVEENDLSGLPYIDAIIMESMRLHPLATLLAPHYSIEDCKVADYHIPKGTMVLINTWSIGRNPKFWDTPLEFIPERFIGQNIDVTGSNYALLPFGSGRRRCPAINVALKMVRTTLANILHGFNLKLLDGMTSEDISLEEQYGLATHPKHPLTIIMEPSLASHLY